MSNTSIIFGRKTVPVKPKIINQKSTVSKPRKKRSDAKHDIKFKLSSSDKKVLKLKAMDHQLSLTAFASMVVQSEMFKENDYENHEYDNYGEFIHVVLEEDFFKMIQRRSVEWGMPYRRVVHRIVKEYLERSNTGITIHHHARGIVE